MAPTISRKLDQWRPAFPRLFHFCVGVLAATNILLGIYLTTAPAGKFSAPGWAAIKQLAPMHIWGIWYLVAGILIACYSTASKRMLSQVGLLLGAVVCAIFAFGIVNQSLESQNGVSLFVPIMLGPLIIFHLAFIVGVGTSDS